jgi:hypothetical protein
VELADPFEQHHLFTVVLELLRTAGHDLDTMAHALVLGRSRLREHPTDLVAWRASRLLERGVAFLGGEAQMGSVRAAVPRR